MLLPHEVAKLEEKRLALALSELADEHLEVGGGVAAYGGRPVSWMNLVADVAMRGPVDDDALDAIVAFYDERGADPAIEVCPFADRGLARGMCRRGFFLSRFETVLYRGVEGAAACAPDGLRYERIDPARPDDVETFVAAHLACFAPAPGERRDAMEEGARRMLRHERVTTWILRLHGEVAGAGGLEVYGRVGTLIAAGVLDAYRRRGLQRAFIDHRVVVARDRGCDVVTIGSDPQSPTGRNALRSGFVTAYTKGVLERRER